MNTYHVLSDCSTRKLFQEYAFVGDYYYQDQQASLWRWQLVEQHIWHCYHFSSLLELVVSHYSHHHENLILMLTQRDAVSWHTSRLFPLRFYVKHVLLLLRSFPRTNRLFVLLPFLLLTICALCIHVYYIFGKQVFVPHSRNNPIILYPLTERFLPS